MKFGSVCSGIEAASVAWGPLGWKAAWFSEIEPFPSAVLSYHYPNVPNLGDMTTLPDRIANGEVEAPDLFCGGTPCQAFSVAGTRKSLDDVRGNLSLVFCEIANAIDTRRAGCAQQPAIIFWENVPGVLSTKDNAFGCFLAGLAGEDDQIVPPGEKWSNVGAVYGPKRAVAWRVLDAQYFGVAQRRRRVFVVASARNNFDPAAVLFEFDGLRRDITPSRQAREKTTVFTPSSIGGYREGFGTLRANGGDIGGGSENLVAKCLTRGACQRFDFETEDFVLQPAYAIQGSMIGRSDDAGPQGDGINEEVCFTQNTIDRHAVAQPIAFPANLSSTQYASTENLAPSMGAKNPTAVVQPFGGMSHVAGTLTANTGGMTRPAGNANETDFCVPIGMAVRRLTPIECERLQGFEDNYTAIPWRNKPIEECPDSPRYKALGNSWAVPNVRWIGKRIQLALEVRV
jgi:DNA (cytosine-5)-methyltransferase 1